jgi:hypothetical protein
MPLCGERLLYIRRLILDVDKAITRPDLFDLASAIEKVAGVQGANISVTEIDIETMGLDITVEGEGIDHVALIKAIESTGAVVHSIDQVVFGSKLVERVKI